MDAAWPKLQLSSSSIGLGFFFCPAPDEHLNAGVYQQRLLALIQLLLHTTTRMHQNDHILQKKE